jgi:hypothetical protein
MEKANNSDNPSLVNFIKSHSSKKLIKYMNFSEVPYSYIPPNYPWMVRNQINLANYIGYEQHLSEDNDYRKYVRFYGDVDWQWLRETGDDYLIYDKTAYKKYQHEIDQYADPGIRMILSNEDTVAKVKPNFPLYPEGKWSVVDDNGYVILLSEGLKSTMTGFHANAQKVIFDLKVNGKKSRLLLPIWANRHLRLIVNNQKSHFSKWHDHYYHDFNGGNYKVKIVYQNAIQNLFLWIMSIYCLAIIGAGIYKIWRLWSHRKTN